MIKTKTKEIIHKILELDASSEEIARGVAIGVFIGIFPTFGVGFLLALGLAFIFKANKAAALLATLIGNPYFLPFIWVASYFLGIFVLDKDWHGLVSHFNFKKIPQEALLPYFVGNVILSLLLTLLSYLLARHLVNFYRHQKR